MVSRNITAIGSELVFHESGYFQSIYKPQPDIINHSFAIQESLFVDWRKLQDPVELKSFCNTFLINKKDIIKREIEWVDIPAAQFWFGAVPANVIKSEATFPGCKTKEQVISYSTK